MAIAPYKKGTRSNSKLFRGRKAPKRPTSPRPVAEEIDTYRAGRKRPLPAFFIGGIKDVKEVNEIKEKNRGGRQALSERLLGRLNGFCGCEKGEKKQS